MAIFAIRQQRDLGASAGKLDTSRRTVITTSSASSGPTTTATSASAATGSSGSSPVAAAKVPLVVLNNTMTSGLAQSAATRFGAGGWTVTKYDNYQNDIVSTCAYYDPDVPGAQAAAQALQRQFPTIKRVEPQFAGLAAWHSPIIVILTPDYTP